MFSDAIAQAALCAPSPPSSPASRSTSPRRRRLEVLTGLSHSTAERRAHPLIKWRRSVQGPTRENNVGVELADPTRRSGVDPGNFEKIVADLLRAIGYLGVTQRGGSFDGGVDVVAGRVDAWGHRSELAGVLLQFGKRQSARQI